MTVGNCLMCGDKLKYYDSVRRIVRTKSRKSRWIKGYEYQKVETIRKEISDMRIQLQRIRFKNMRMGR